MHFAAICMAFTARVATGARAFQTGHLTLLTDCHPLATPHRTGHLSHRAPRPEGYALRARSRGNWQPNCSGTERKPRYDLLEVTSTIPTYPTKIAIALERVPRSRGSRALQSHEPLPLVFPLTELIQLLVYFAWKPVGEDAAGSPKVLSDATCKLLTGLRARALALSTSFRVWLSRELNAPSCRRSSSQSRICLQWCCLCSLQAAPGKGDTDARLPGRCGCKASVFAARRHMHHHSQKTSSRAGSSCHRALSLMFCSPS